MTPLVPVSDFVDLDGATYLYTAAECPLLTRSADAMRAYAHHKSRAEAGRAHHAEIAAACKASVARLLDVAPGELAFLSSASEGINAVCGLIDFRSGDNVVVNDLEFPSVTLPWLRLRDRGVEVRVVRHRHWGITPDMLLHAVDDRTRLVALSQVSYVNGLCHDVGAIDEGLRQTNALLLVDATQSAGVLPVPARAADFVVASTYKWLLGTHGLGVLYWNRLRRPDVQPPAIGWYSVTSTFAPDRYERYTLKPDAGRFETGYVNLPAIYALSESVPYLLAVGVERIAAHARSLGDLLIARLDALGLEVISPRRAQERGASVSFAHDRAAEIGRALAEERVHVWAGDGRVRASTHLFNGAEDVHRYADVLASVLGRL